MSIVSLKIAAMAVILLTALGFGLIVLFSSMTPLGILIGTVMSSLVTGRGADICEGVFDSVAAGTFLYVATLDIISEEFSRQADRRLKFALLALGFAFMSMLALWT